MSEKPDHAFILAAGQGTRLRPYTDDTPKPMVEINGRPILDYTLEKLKKAGISNVTINTSYLGDRIKNYTDTVQDITITLSSEEELLDTGGGVKKALANMKGKPFYLINGDALWTDTPNLSALDNLAKKWQPDKMDILLLLQPVSAMTLTKGIGDYDMDDQGRAIRSKDKAGEYIFGGIRITKPNIFENTPDGAFSFLELMDKAEEQERLYGITHQGDWHHISTPEDLENVNAAFAADQKLKAKSA